MKIKINSMDTESTPSDDEIRSFMNFDAVVEAARKKSIRQNAKKLWVVAPVALALFSVWYVLVNQDQDTVQNQTVADKNHGTHPSAQTDNDEAGNAIDPLKQTDSLVTDVSKNIKRGQTAKGKNQPPVNSQRARPAESKGSEVERHSAGPWTLPGDKKGDVYVQAEPRDGYTQLYEYFGRNLTYPKEAIRDSIEGVETVSFTIDEAGHPQNIGITQSLGKAFDHEAMRLIKEMPPWKPATLNDRPVASQLSLPLTFEIKRIKKH
ncbi:MAG: energy transducer TonB [Chryseolinea sp.]